MANQPLWMPKGSVRGVLALAVVITFCIVVAASAIQGRIVVSGKDIVYIVIIVMQAYFASKKSGEDIGNEPPVKEKKREVIVNEETDQI